MPASPDLGARLAFEAVEIVATAELQILRTIARRLAAGLDAPGWAETKLAELQLLRAQLTRELAAMDAQLAAAVNDAIRRGYGRGQAMAVADLDRLALSVALPPAQMAAVTTIAADVAARVTGLAPRVLRTVTDAYQEAVGVTVGNVTLGVQTRRQAAQTVLDRLLGQGIGGFTDSADRNWRLESYTEMAVRTGAGQAAIAGHIDTLVASGQDLVHIIPGPRACPVCDYWAGKILSLTGTALTIVAPGGRAEVDRTLEQARGDGFQHPNCRCNIGIYLPGVTATTTARPDPSGYELQQEQRRLERRIRDAKRRQALALDDTAGAKADRRIRAAQADLRAHLVAHPELKRQRYREQVRRTI